MRKVILLVGFMAASAAMLAGSEPQLTTVRHVDLGRYSGRWYEIARYPNWFERRCDRDVTAEYSLKADGKIRVVNRCIGRAGTVEQSVGTAKVVDASTNAKLKVTFFWPFYGNYWVIDLGNEYEYAVIGEPSRKYLWILSRSPVIQDLDYQDILRRLTVQGYDPLKLVRTNQTIPAKP